MEELGSKVVVDGYKRDELMGSNLRGLAYCMLRVWKAGGTGARKMMSLYTVQDRRGEGAQMVLDGEPGR